MSRFSDKSHRTSISLNKTSIAVESEESLMKLYDKNPKKLVDYLVARCARYKSAVPLYDINRVKSSGYTKHLLDEIVQIIKNLICMKRCLHSVYCSVDEKMMSLVETLEVSLRESIETYYELLHTTKIKLQVLSDEAKAEEQLTEKSTEENAVGAGFEDKTGRTQSEESAALCRSENEANEVSDSIFPRNENTWKYILPRSTMIQEISICTDMQDISRIVEKKIGESLSNVKLISLKTNDVKNLKILKENLEKKSSRLPEECNQVLKKEAVLAFRDATKWIEQVDTMILERQLHIQSEFEDQMLLELKPFTGYANLTTNVYEFFSTYELISRNYTDKDKALYLYANYLSVNIKNEVRHIRYDYAKMKEFIISRHGNVNILLSHKRKQIKGLSPINRKSPRQEQISYIKSYCTVLNQLISLLDINELNYPLMKSELLSYYSVMELAKLLPEMLFKRFNSAYVKETHRRDLYALTGEDAFDILVKTLKYCLSELEHGEEVFHENDDKVTEVNMFTKPGEMMRVDVSSDDSHEIESRKCMVNLINFLPPVHHNCQQIPFDVFKDDNYENPIQSAVKCENDDTLETFDDDYLTDSSYHVHVEHTIYEEQGECSSDKVITSILEKEPITKELEQSSIDFDADPAGVDITFEIDVKGYSIEEDIQDQENVCKLPEVIYVDRVIAADSENSEAETDTADVNAKDTSDAIDVIADDAADEHIDVTSDVKAVDEFDIANYSMEYLALDVFEKEPDFDYDIDMIDVTAAEFSRVANVKGIAGQIWKKKRMILDFTTILGKVGMKNCCYFFLLVGISNLVIVLISVVLSFKHRPDRTESGQVLKRSCEYSKFEVNELVVYLNQDDAYPRKRRKVFI